MKLKLPPPLVRQSLASHSWIGLLIGLPMFLISLSGTLAVFNPELERWEQPRIAEQAGYGAAAIDRAYRAAIARAEAPSESVFIQMPTADAPRAYVTIGKDGWFINSDGSLGEVVHHPWTDFLVDLHLYLNLPHSYGLILVGAAGALLCGLIISGFLAHPSIFKDAFKLRLDGSHRLEQTDIHNRLSVWGAPFHLMIGLTGAYFGLAGLLMSAVLASAFFNGDASAVTQTVFGKDPALEQPVAPAAVGAALLEMPRIAHKATPFYVTVEKAGTPGQFILIGARIPERLIYAEQYRFNNLGHYIDKAGYSDGALGRQAVFSVYRIHFGWFDGFAVKVLYGVFGLALTIVSVTGINIWLARRKYRDFLNNAWAGLVWAAVPALALSALAEITAGLPATLIFWAVLLVSSTVAQWIDERRLVRLLQAFGATLLTLLVVAHVLIFSTAAISSAALGINAALLGAAILHLLLAAR